MVEVLIRALDIATCIASVIGGVAAVYLIIAMRKGKL